ncbi:MAG: LysR family transcriptional regulator [Devosiaceae bacterium]|nr:LysR family transcriptional regulator [Devosiaceae bacterium MH13]
MGSLTRLPSLALLRCFETSAKHESFTAAAEELGLTQGAVSRQVKELEQQLGATLFRRIGRGIKLTEAGQSFAQALTSDLQRIRQTVDKVVATGSRPQALSIAALPTFGSRWLVPRLRAFRDLHPDVELLVQSRAEPFDLVEARVDVAIHFGGFDWPGAQLTPLCPERLVVVAAPALLSDGAPGTLEGIIALPLLHLSARPSLWEDFIKAADPNAQVPRSGARFDQFSLVIAAAVEGMGVAILPTYLIENELAAGQLVQLADGPSSKGQSYFVATPLGTHSALANAFTAWVRQQVRTRSD